MKMRIPVTRAVAGLGPYRAPGEGRAGKLRLDFNENTIGCSPAVVRALRELTAERLATYPEYSAVTARLARHFGVRPAELMLTNGIDDGLRLLVDTFIEPRDTVLIAEPTFDMYRFYAQVGGASVRALRYDGEMRFPLEDAIAALRAKERRARPPKAFFIANPNNPTGTLVKRDGLRKILDAARNTLVLVDEAYFEFSGVTVLPWIRRYPNLVVARTFSKGMGLAGLRLGCLFAQPAIIASLLKAGSPFAVNSAAVLAAEAACKDRTWVKNFAREVRQSREELSRGLAHLGMRIYPSAANFVLADFGSRAPRLLRALQQRGILLRDRSNDFGRSGPVRVTVGTRAQTRMLLRAIEQLW
jgi:histidinol-phosphate aminotransferase